MVSTSNVAVDGNVRVKVIVKVNVIVKVKADGREVTPRSPGDHAPGRRAEL